MVTGVPTAGVADETVAETDGCTIAAGIVVMAAFVAVLALTVTAADTGIAMIIASRTNAIPASPTE